MPTYFFGFKSTQNNDFGIMYVKNAISLSDAYKQLDEYLKSKGIEGELNPTAYIIEGEYKEEVFPEFRDTVFDNYEGVQLILEIGLDKYKRLQKQNIQREFSRLIGCGEFNRCSEGPVQIDYFRQLLKNKNPDENVELRTEFK